MRKWQHVPEKRRKEIFEFNRQRAADREAAEDLRVLLSLIPPGQQKQLLKIDACAKILSKYGVTG